MSWEESRGVGGIGYGSEGSLALRVGVNGYVALWNDPLGFLYFRDLGILI